VELIVDPEHRGPSEGAWKSTIASTSIKKFAPLDFRKVIVVAPHPDDEVFGAGGLIQAALRAGVPAEVIAVTDGEGSHPLSKTITAHELALTRRRESARALERLGWRDPLVTSLHIRDGAIGESRDQLASLLTGILVPGDLCVAPWRFDGHPDHDACGEAALQACHDVGATLMGYLVWAWHWADPRGADIPWSHCRRLDLSRRATARKRWSSLAFQSQIRSLGPSEADAAILPLPLLRRFWRSYEVFVDESLGA
jgi:LmbE family N-acetylglucosaminyl deacetylase